MTEKELDCRKCGFWRSHHIENSRLGMCSHAEVPVGAAGDLINPLRVTPCRCFAEATPIERVERLLRCPRCMGEGKHYVEFPPGNPQPLDDEPCPDCQGIGERNIDELLNVYMVRAQMWKEQADQFEAILKRAARAKEGGGLQGLLQAADDQRLRRVEKSARELVRELRQLDEAPEGLPALEWALMGGDPEVE